ncbi:MAG: hypothetical protein M9963_04175 [Kiritimatiellae bacterium]|nr:hypothetical protein [Kiritimatiellia bacterium]MCO5067750.1 hypothetical protein [Kiritimatiellia bacterium]
MRSLKSIFSCGKISLLILLASNLPALGLCYRLIRWNQAYDTFESLIGYAIPVFFGIVQVVVIFYSRKLLFLLQATGLLLFMILSWLTRSPTPGLSPAHFIAFALFVLLIREYFALPTTEGQPLKNNY